MQTIYNEHSLLWPEMRVIQRSWLSANNFVFGGARPSVVDSGYCSEQHQTVVHVRRALDALGVSTRSLAQIVNTHLHSDHCGGNAALQAAFPQARTWVAAPHLEHVKNWDCHALSYVATGQECPRFEAQEALEAGKLITLGEHQWEIHSAPGHDPDSVLLFEPQRRILISADALWENGLGIIFPELEGQSAFETASATLDIIEQMRPALVLPGHGAIFSNADQALATARRRLDGFVNQPQRHALYAAKALLKYKFLAWKRASFAQALAWCEATPCMEIVRREHFSHLETAQEWTRFLLNDLARSGALAWQAEEYLVDI